MRLLILSLLRLAFLGACLVAIGAALMPAVDHPPHLFGWDKADHFFAFYVLSLLGCAAFPRAPAVLIGLGLCALGGGIELAQAMPLIGRDSDIRDWLADSLAILAAMVPLAAAHWRALAASRHADGPI